MQINVNSTYFFALLGCALAAYVFFVQHPGVAQKGERPNVLVIMIDTVRADHLGVYGYNKQTSPFLDSLFKKGVIFEHAYAPAYLTFQTDAAVLSGLYPSENNVRTWTTPVRDDIRLLPEVFQLYGYETHMFSWPALQPYFGLDRGFDTYRNYQKIQNFADSKPDVLKTIAEQQKPFFIYWTIYDVHVPMSPPLPEFGVSGYEGPYAQKSSFKYTDQSTTTIPFRDANGEVVQHTKTDADREYVTAQYDSGIRRVDDGLKDVFAELSRMGKLKNTIVVISSEHGEDLGEHGFFFHRDVYENGVHVPLAIIYPRELRPQRVETPVSLIDLAPTLTDLAELPRFEAGSGVSIVPRREAKEPTPRPIYIERQPFKEFAVIRWPFKYIVRDLSHDAEGLSSAEENDFFRELRANDPIRDTEIFNLAGDPGETLNLAGSGLLEEIELASLARKYRERMIDGLRRAASIPPITNREMHFTYP